MPPLLPNSRVLFAGLLAFFCALSFDRPLHPGISNWHLGAEPFGFLLTDEMRAATRIQEAILPCAVLSLKDVQMLCGTCICRNHALSVEISTETLTFLKQAEPSAEQHS
jgi:hypothetical protein